MAHRVDVTEVAITQGSIFQFVGELDGAIMTSSFMGSANGNVNSGHGFIGVIDEVAIYDKVLTQAQITAHFNAGKP